MEVIKKSIRSNLLILKIKPRFSNYTKIEPFNCNPSNYIRLSEIKCQNPEVNRIL